MSSDLEKYRQAQRTVTELEEAARKELIDRFHALHAELVSVKQELRAFGVKAIPKAVKQRKPRAVDVQRNSKKITDAVQTQLLTSHRIAKDISDLVNVSKTAVQHEAKALSPDAAKRIGAMERKLETQKKRLAQASASGKSTAKIDGEIYRLRDDIELEREKAS